MSTIAHLRSGFLPDEARLGAASAAPVPVPDAGFIGVVSPMTSLGFAPFSYLGVVHPEGLALTSAAYYQVTVTRQQERIVERLLATPYEELAQRPNVLLFPRYRIERAELVRQFLVGYRIELHMRGGRTTRLVVQQGRLEQIRRYLPTLLGDDWTDRSLEAA